MKIHSPTPCRRLLVCNVPTLPSWKGGGQQLDTCSLLTVFLTNLQRGKGAQSDWCFLKIVGPQNRAAATRDVLGARVISQEMLGISKHQERFKKTCLDIVFLPWGCFLFAGASEQILKGRQGCHTSPGHRWKVHFCCRFASSKVCDVGGRRFWASGKGTGLWCCATRVSHSWTVRQNAGTLLFPPK